MKPVTASTATKRLSGGFFQSAFAALGHCESKAFYDRKRTERKRHTQAAVIALARRRINVIWGIFKTRQSFLEKFK